jgi:hypothetical protein
MTVRYPENPNLSGAFDDAVSILKGMDSSGINLANLFTRDLPRWSAVLLHEKVPLDLLRSLVERISASDFYRNGNPTVFLRHGYLTGVTSMNSFGKSLDREWGINSHQFAFRADLDWLSEKLLKKLEKAKSEDKEVLAFTHSKGSLSLIGAYQRNPHCLDRFVTTAPPYYGTLMADKYWLPVKTILPWIDLREFKTDSSVLRRFRNRGIPKDVPILNFYSDNDEFIKPFENARLPDQKNITNLLIPGIKHNGFLYNPLIQQASKLFLEGYQIDDYFFDKLDQILDYKETHRIREIVNRNNL